MFVAEHSIARAEGLVERLRKRCRILEAHPLAGRARSDIGEGLRALFERPYVIVYHVNDDDVEIVAVVHGMRDIPAAIATRIASPPTD